MQRDPRLAITVQMVEEVIVDVAIYLLSIAPIMNADESAIQATVKKVKWTRFSRFLVLK
jgi:hypothetical protein